MASAVGLNLTSGQWQALSKITLGTDGSVKGEGDLSSSPGTGAESVLKSDRIRLNQNTSAVSSPAAGDFWLDRNTGSDRLYFYDSDGGVARGLIHDADQLSGDVTGALDSNEVTKIRGYAVQDAAPSDGDVLTWNTSNSQYEPSAPSTGSTTTTLTNSATTSDLNTALTNYDIVYLETGAYSNVTGKVTVPSGKRLVGLGGGDLSSSSTAPEITLTTSGTIYVEQQSGSIIEGVRFVFGSSSGADMIQSTNGICRFVRVYSASAITYYAFSGSLIENTHCHVENCGGVSFTTAPTVYTGRPSISWFWGDGGSASTMGLYVNVAYVSVSNCHLLHYDGTAGVYLANSADHFHLSGIRTYSCGGSAYGTRVNGSNGTAEGIYSNADYNGIGFFGSANSIGVLHVHTSSNYGIYISGDYLAIGALYSNNAGNYGVNCDSMRHSTIASIGSYSAGNDGVRLYDVDYCSIGVIESEAARGTASSHGVYIYNTFRTSVSTISIYDAQGSGLFMGYNSEISVGVVNSSYCDVDGVYIVGCDYGQIGLISVYSNSGDGVQTYSGCNGLMISCIEAHNNGGYGLNQASTGGAPNCMVFGLLANNNTTGQWTTSSGWQNDRFFN